MLIRILLVGSPAERNAVIRAVREAFAGLVAFKIEFIEFLRFSQATMHLDMSDYPAYAVTTPSCQLDEALDLLRHVRGCGRTVPFMIWRHASIPRELREHATQLCGIVVTSDNPIFVTKEIVDHLVASAQQRGFIRAPATIHA